MPDPRDARSFVRGTLASLCHDRTIVRARWLSGQRGVRFANCEDGKRWVSLDGAVACNFAWTSISKIPPLQVDEADGIHCGRHVGSRVRSIAYPRASHAKNENALSVERATAVQRKIGNLSSPVYWDTS